MLGRARLRISIGLLAVAVISLVGLAGLNREVEPSGGCPVVLGEAAWTDWVFVFLAPGSVLAASLSAGAFMVRARQTLLISFAFAVSAGVGWLLLLYGALIAIPRPC